MRSHSTLPGKHEFGGGITQPSTIAKRVDTGEGGIGPFLYKLPYHSDLKALCFSTLFREDLLVKNKN